MSPYLAMRCMQLGMVCRLRAPWRGKWASVRLACDASGMRMGSSPIPNTCLHRCIFVSYRADPIGKNLIYFSRSPAKIRHNALCMHS